ncbi:MAG: hypothetical protein V1725_00845 [archaeon]
MRCVICLKELEDEEDVCFTCKAFFEMLCPDMEERIAILELFRQQYETEREGKP